MTKPISGFPVKTDAVGGDFITILDSEVATSSSKNKKMTFVNALKKWFAPVDANNQPVSNLGITTMSKAIKFTGDIAVTIDASKQLTLPEDGNFFKIMTTTETNLELINGDNWPLGSVVFLRCNDPDVIVKNGTSISSSGSFKRIFLQYNYDYHMKGGSMLVLCRVNNDFWAEVGRMDRDGLNGTLTNLIELVNSGAGGNVEIISNSSVKEATVNGNLIFTNRRKDTQGADVASATDITLGDDGNMFRVTGSNNIEGINGDNWEDGSEIVLTFDSNLELKDQANSSSVAPYLKMRLAAASNHSVSATDNITFRRTNGEWHEVSRTVLNAP